MIPPRLRLAGAAALLAAALACGDRRPAPPKMAEVFPALPLPPGGRMVGRAGGEDALQLTMLSPLPRGKVEAYYRTALNQNGWTLLNAAPDPDAAMVLLAEREGHPLWVRIRAAEDTMQSLVEFSGARVSGPGKPAS